MTEEKFLKTQEDDLEYYKISSDDYQQIVSQLPDKKYYEYIYHKLTNTDVTFEKWNHWPIWNYPVQDALRFKYILLDNVQYIKNSCVADFGCHIGYMSLFMSHLGAKHITGTNIRQKELDLSKELCDIAGANNIDFRHSDLHNYQNVLEICNNHQTILFSGIMYHLTDQVNLLETVTKSSATTLIIDTREPISIKGNSQPLMAYTIENSSVNVNGFVESAESNSMLVGAPNQSWIDYTMVHFGWKKVYDKQYTMKHQGNSQRSVSTWTRDITYIAGWRSSISLGS